MRRSWIGRCRAAVLALGFAAFATGSVFAQEIIISFSRDEVWQPGQGAVQALFSCRPRTFSCVQQVMQDDGASSDAIAFFGLTDWFLWDLNDSNPVMIGTIFTPWRANENTQTALVGGIPAVVYLEQEVPAFAAENSADFKSIQSAHPNALFWRSSPALDRIETSPQGGQRFVFLYRVLDGCHVCAILGEIPVAFDFASDGTYQSAKVLSGA